MGSWSASPPVLTPLQFCLWCELALHCVCMKNQTLVLSLTQFCFSCFVLFWRPNRKKPLIFKTSLLLYHFPHMLHPWFCSSLSPRSRRRNSSRPTFLQPDRPPAGRPPQTSEIFWSCSEFTEWGSRSGTSIRMQALESDLNGFRGLRSGFGVFVRVRFFVQRIDYGVGKRGLTSSISNPICFVIMTSGESNLHHGWIFMNVCRK